MGGPPMVNGADFMAVCTRQGWDDDVAFYLLDRVLTVYAERAQADKP